MAGGKSHCRWCGHNKKILCEAYSCLGAQKRVRLYACVDVPQHSSMYALQQ